MKTKLGLTPNAFESSSQCGTAIILAIFIIAIVSTMSTLLLIRSQLGIQNTQAILTLSKFYWYSHGITEWAKVALQNAWNIKKPGQVVDTFPLTTTLQTDDMTIGGEVEDLQSRFNLNNLTSESYYPDFKRLLRAINPQLKDEQINLITGALTNWLKSDQASSEYDTYYFKHNPPYRAAHRLMISSSELKLVQGMSIELYQALAPHITALPGTTLVNINTASAPVLMSLSAAITPDIAKMILEQRRSRPFVSVEDFNKRLKIRSQDTDLQSLAGKITVVSSYFLASASGKVANTDYQVFTLLKRNTDEHAAHITILGQSFGSL